MNESRPQPVLFRSRETGPSPRGTPPYRPRQSGGTHCRNQIRRVSPTRSTRSAPTKADASTTFFHGSRTSSTPPGTTYSTEDRYRAQRIGIRLVLTCYGICPTCLREGRGLTSQPAAWNHAFCVSETPADVSRNIAVGCFTIGSRGNRLTSMVWASWQSADVTPAAWHSQDR